MKRIKYSGPGERLDIFLKNQLSFSRSYIQKIIKQKLTKVNTKNIKPSFKLKEGDIVEYKIPAPEKLNLTAENIPLDIVFEDKHILVINKQAGLVVHPAAGNRSGTLVNALLHHCRNLSGIGGVERPGIVHRLDKFTSGLMVIAKDDLSHQNLCSQFKEHKINKKYLALVHETPKQKEGLISNNIIRHPVKRKKFKACRDLTQGRTALTSYKLIKSYNTTSLLEITPKTGRTHQIRVHLASIGHPIVGDPDYGHKKDRKEGQLLHAFHLSFSHPITNKKLTFTSRLPDRFGIHYDIRK